LRLRYPVVKKEMVARLTQNPPASIGGVALQGVETLDGVKYRLEGDSWLLIRPSGTEPVLRVYAEASSEDAIKALMAYGGEVAATA